MIVDGGLEMAIATMTSKGQITVPKEVRDTLRLEPGDKVMFVALPNGRATIVPRNRSIEELFGLLYDPDIPPMTIEEMNEAIAEGAAESGMRGMR